MGKLIFNRRNRFGAQGRCTAADPRYMREVVCLNQGVIEEEKDQRGHKTEDTDFVEGDCAEEVGQGERGREDD